MSLNPPPPMASPPEELPPVDENQTMAIARHRPSILPAIASIALTLVFSVGGIQPALAFADPPPPVPVPAPTPQGTGDGSYLSPAQIAALNDAIDVAKRTGTGISCIRFYAVAVATRQVSSPIPPDCSGVIEIVKAMVPDPAPYGPQPADITPAPVPTPSH